MRCNCFEDKIVVSKLNTNVPTRYEITMFKDRQEVKYMNRNNIIYKFITLDIETRTIDNIMKPYCISYFDGVKATSFYLTDYGSPEEMMVKCIMKPLRIPYLFIYTHNILSLGKGVDNAHTLLSWDTSRRG